MDKSDLILQELRALNNKFDEKFEGVDKKFASIDEKFASIDEKFAQIDKKFDQIDEKFASIDENLARIDRRITRVDMDNKEEHIKIRKLLNSINSAFLRFEAEHSDKISILFDAYKDYTEHKDVYAHEFVRLNDLVAKNSFRISNLEQHFQTN